MAARRPTTKDAPPAQAAEGEFPPYVVRQVEELIPYARNARTHSEAQVAQIAASIREFGFTNPVLLDGERGILAGHGRVLAARKLGLDVVPCIELSHLTPQQRKAYILADNKLALNAGWDDELLKLELQELQASDFDVVLTGFSEGEMDALLNGWAPDMDKIDKVDPDDSPLNATIKVKCAQEISEAVEQTIRAALAEAGHTGVTVE